MEKMEEVEEPPVGVVDEGVEALVKPLPEYHRRHGLVGGGVVRSFEEWWLGIGVVR